MIFQNDFRVNSHSCDMDRIARPGAVMSYLQEAANLQIETYGPSDKEMREAGQFFVLSRFALTLASPIRAYETLRAETWAVPSRGFSFFRCHRLLRGDEVICDATSVWALIGAEDKRPLRTDAYHPNFDTEPLSDFGVPDRIRVNQDLLEKIGTHTVDYRDTDLNMHMNNTVYPDMLCAFLDMQNKYVRHLSINYFHEAPLNETLTVFMQETENDVHLFRTLREDGQTNVEAAITLSKL